MRQYRKSSDTTAFCCILRWHLKHTAYLMIGDITFGMFSFQVLRTAVGHRLAKVQGFLFKAAFLRRVPTFTRLSIENLILCFLQSAVYQTSKYLTGSLNLRFKKILTDLVHADYFQVHQLINFAYVVVEHSSLVLASRIC